MTSTIVIASKECPVQTVTKGFTDIQNMLHKYQEAAASLEAIRKVQEKQIQQLSEEMATLENGRPHTYVPFEGFQQQAAELKLLKEQWSTQTGETGVTPPEGVVTGAFATLQRMFGIYQQIILKLRDINAKQKEAISRLEQEVQMLKDPLHHIDEPLRAVCNGELTLFLEMRPELGAKAATLLNQLLERFPEKAETIYHLAIFVAQKGPNLLARDTPLYESLRNWALKRAGEGETFINKRTLLLLAMGQSANRGPKDLYDPLLVIAGLQAHIEPVSRLIGNPVEFSTAASTYIENIEKQQPTDGATKGKVNGLVIWARNLMNKTEKTRAEEILCRLIEERVATINHFPTLQNPVAPHSPLSLLEQLQKDPKFSVSVSEKGEEWKRSKHIRETLIAQALAPLCDWEDLKGRILQARSDEDVQIQGQVETMNTGFIEVVAERIGKGRVEEGERTLLLTQIEEAIYESCKSLTHLTSQTPSEFAKEFCAKYASGELSQKFQNILLQGDGKHALFLAQLVYYHQAISHMKQGFEGFASHHEWDWLTYDGLELPEAAKRMQTLIQAFHQDRNFQGSAMVPKQVRWASHLHDLMRTGKVFPIYSDAGSGKTSTAIFTMRLLRKALPEICANKDVHLLSPFYTEVAGLHCHQMIDSKGTIFIDVSDEEHLHDVVLVDEAHILDPDVKIVLCSPSGKRREVEPLPMTATPVIPNDGYEGFKKVLHEKLREKYATYSASYQALLSHLQEQKREVTKTVATAIVSAAKTKQADYQRYTNNLPIAQREYFKKHLARVCNGTYVKEDIERLLVTMHWFLRAGQKEGETFTPDHLSYVKSIIPSGFNPLQSLDEKEFKVAKKLFVELEKQLKQLQRFQNGDFKGIEMPAEIVEREKILNGAAENLKELRLKLEKWDRQDALNRVDDGDEILRTLPQKRKAKFATIEYISKPLQLFTPETAAAEISAMPTPNHPVIQLIYPGVRFTHENFPELIKTLQPVFAQKFPGKEIYFGYQDSHSNNREKGQKFVVRFNEEGKVTATLAHGEFDPNRHVAVLLYDTTNKQGGDFNSLSRVVPGRFEIAQYLFYHLTDHLDVNPQTLTSGNDLYQAQSRRRGVSTLSSVVMAPGDAKESFIESVTQRQWALEKSWAARNSANRIAKKILKSSAQIRTPQMMPTLRHQTTDVVQAHVAKTMLGLETIHLVDTMRKAIVNTPADKEMNGKSIGVTLKHAIEHDNVVIRTLIEEALVKEPEGEDEKRQLVIPEADKIGVWRIEKMREEIAYLTQAAVQYRPAAEF